MRNSSLVEGSGAENVTGLKFTAEAVDVQVQGRKPKDQWPQPYWASLPSGGWSPLAGGVGGNLVGLLGYCLGVVGERSSGDEVSM